MTDRAKHSVQFCSGRVLLLCLLLMGANTLNAQLPGRLVLVGGGSEQQNGWSDAPYSWPLQFYSAPRVAILTYAANPTAWLPDYFQSLGADTAQNIVIDASQANKVTIYDSLQAFDVLFIKGGDQWTYHDLWAGTLTEQAIQDKFDAGGTIMGTSAGMAILSSPWFSAQNGTVYPDELLADYNINFATLRTDFVGLLPGFLFDTHFVERGRLGRLASFLARYYHDSSQVVTGIGVDDKTALCILPDTLGLVLGTGGVSWLRPQNTTPFVANPAALPLADSLRWVKGLSGDTLLLNSGELRPNNAPPVGRYTTGAGHDSLLTLNPIPNAGYFPGAPIFLSGSDSLSENFALLDSFLNVPLLGPPPAQIRVGILTGTDSSLAQAYKQELLARGADAVHILQIQPQLVGTPAYDSLFVSFGERLLVVDLPGEQLNTLVDLYGQTGAAPPPVIDVLRNTPPSDQPHAHTLAFIGRAARLVGDNYAENYEQDGAAYTGQLTFKQGLGLYPHTFVQPETYPLNTDFYENTIGGAPWAMATYQLDKTLWLSPGCWTVSAATVPGGQPVLNPVYLRAYGSRSTMMALCNPDTSALLFAGNAIGSATVYADTATVPYTLNVPETRTLGSTSAYTLKLLAKGNRVRMGLYFVGTSARAAIQAAAPAVHAFPNPATTHVFLQAADLPSRDAFTAWDMNGRRVELPVTQRRATGVRLHTGHLPAGLYLIQTGKSNYVKLLIQR